ncbi:MAG: DUF2442 domain-containing protein [Muribaculaceae bacterium]|nr:DUF2442 domain-containing protein [Muribaculaceae bacterium]MCM1492276.1 DUF2442 domain-containing protein [Muribaculaceae bacterium]
MSSSMENSRALRVWFDDDNMWISLEDGRVLAVPKMWFPKLAEAADEELADYEMSGNGIGIHWEKLDEDISVPNLLMGYGAVRDYKKLAL